MAEVDGILNQIRQRQAARAVGGAGEAASGPGEEAAAPSGPTLSFVLETKHSVDRATLMAVIYFAARAIDQRSPPLNALSLAATALTVADPLIVADPAFLLTFGATLAILAVVPVLTAPDRTKDRPGRQDRFRATVSEVKRAAFAMFAASLAAEALLFPVGALTFSRVTFADLLGAKAQRHDAASGAKQASQQLVWTAGEFAVRHLRKRQNSRIESERAVHVGDSEADGDEARHRQRRAAAAGRRRTGRREGDAEDQGRRQDRRAQRWTDATPLADWRHDALSIETAVRAPSCTRMWSPTRSALAMMVSAGLTAPLDGKKPPSTT